jgi:hypothetical protein
MDEAFFRSLLVVLHAPTLDLLLGVSERAEPVMVQAFIMELSQDRDTRATPACG